MDTWLHCHPYIGPQRQDQVHLRAESDNTDPLTGHNGVAFVDETDYLSDKPRCDLNDSDL